MTLLASRLFCHLLFVFYVFFRSPFSCLSLRELFFMDTFGGLLYPLIEFISFHSLFIIILNSNVHIRYTHELYQRGTYL